MLKLRISTSAILFLLLLAFSNSALAATIVFDETNFLVSTTTTASINLNPNPASAPAIPGDGTFTLDPIPGNLSLATNQGRFLRYEFILPSVYSNLEFNFLAFINDEFALYINDTVVAMQTDASTVNFADPFPGFFLNSSGVASDTSSGKLNYLLTSGMQSLFQSGANDLTFFATDTLLGGRIHAINGTISFNTPQPPTPGVVPEPSTLALIGLGLVGLAGALRKRRNG